MRCKVTLTGKCGLCGHLSLVLVLLCNFEFSDISKLFGSITYFVDYISA